jgi:hypothetical protein
VDAGRGASAADGSGGAPSQSSGGRAGVGGAEGTGAIGTGGGSGGGGMGGGSAGVPDGAPPDAPVNVVTPYECLDAGALPDAALPAFPYAPANFTPDEVAASAAGVPETTVFDCGETRFDSTSLQFENWCRGCLPTPTVIQQPGGPEAVVLPFRNLRIDGGARFRLVGSRPVIVAVFGDALLMDLIDASPTEDGLEGAGASWQCGSSAGQAGGVDSAGGGGGNRTSGAKGGGFYGGLGGVARGDAALIPLIGGCPGGAGDGGIAGGKGGGAVQLSVAGELTAIPDSGGVVAYGGDGESDTAESLHAGGGGSGGSVLVEFMRLVGGPPAGTRGGDGGRSFILLGGAGGSTLSGAGAGQLDNLGSTSGGGGGDGWVRVVNHSLPAPPPDAGVDGGG